LSTLKESAKAGAVGGAVGGPPSFFWSQQDWLYSFDYLSMVLAIGFSVTTVVTIFLAIGYMNLARQLKTLKSELGPHPFLSDHHG
jgi:hypothetical protein